MLLTPLQSQDFGDAAIANGMSSSLRAEYLYEPTALLVAYGLSIVSAIACVMLGMVAIRKNGAVFSSNFSTIVRLTRGPELDELIGNEGPLQGADPLPRHVAEAVVIVGQGESPTSLQYCRWV